MLKKRFKLNTSEFKEVFNFGKTTRHPHFLIKNKENSLPYSRYAVVVSKKIAKKAVDRNYLKRKFFHAIEQGYVNHDKSDYIFVLNSSIKDLQYKDLLETLKNL